MPTLAVLLLLNRYKSPEEQKHYWRRVSDFKSINRGWYAVLFLTVPILSAIGLLFDILLGGKGAELEMTVNIIQNPLMLIPFAIILHRR